MKNIHPWQIFTPEKYSPLKNIHPWISTPENIHKLFHKKSFFTNDGFPYMGNWAFWDISVLRHMIIVVDTQGTSNWKSIDNNKIYPSLNTTKIFTFQKRLFFRHAIAKTFICRHGTFKRNDTCRQQMHPSETWPALMKRLVGSYKPGSIIRI